MGGGGWVRFSEDKWVGEIALKYSFPSLFRVTAFPLVRILECFELFEEGIVWDVQFRRDLLDAKIYHMEVR